MFDVKTFVYTALSTASGVTSLLGANGQVLDYEPNVKTLFPVVIISESSQIDTEFADDYPTASESVVTIDVYTKNQSTIPLAIAVSDVFRGLTWACTANRDVPDPMPDVRHRHLEFKRSLVPSEI